MKPGWVIRCKSLGAKSARTVGTWLDTGPGSDALRHRRHLTAHKLRDPAHPIEDVLFSKTLTAIGTATCWHTDVFDFPLCHRKKSQKLLTNPVILDIIVFA